MISLTRVGLFWIVVGCCLCVDDEKCPASVESPSREACDSYLAETGATEWKSPGVFATDHNLICADVIRYRCGATLKLRTTKRGGKTVVKLRIIYKTRRGWKRKYYIYVEPEPATRVLRYQIDKTPDYTIRTDSDSAPNNES